MVTGICTTLLLRALLFSFLFLFFFASLLSRGWWCRHPVYQEYTPLMVSGGDILLPEGAGKEWDEKLLLEWEYRRNKGREWEGRSHHHDHGGVRGGEKKEDSLGSEVRSANPVEPRIVLIQEGGR